MLRASNGFASICPVLAYCCGIWIVGNPLELRSEPIQLTGNRAIYPDGFGRLTVGDISAGTNVSILSSYEFLHGLSGLELRDHYALASVWDDGLNIFDLATDPPDRLAGGRYTTPGTAEDIALFSHYAFIADGTNGIAVIDVFDVRAPLGLETIPLTNRVSSLDQTNGLLFAACGSAGLKIFDVSSPADISLTGQRFTARPARFVKVQNQMAFVVCDNGLLEIISIQNPHAPTLVGSYQSASTLTALDLRGSIAVLAHTNGALVRLQIANAAAPVALGTNQVADGATAVHLGGANAYVRTLTGAMVVVPVAELAPGPPVIHAGVPATIGVVGQTTILSLWCSGSTPLDFRWRKNGALLTNTLHLTGATNAWLVISNATLSDAGVYEVSVSNAWGTVASSNLLTMVLPGAPLLRGTFFVGGTSEDVDVDSGYAYIAAGDYGVEVFNVRNPRYPFRAGGNDVVGYVETVSEQAGHAYLGVGTNGLQVFETTQSTVSELIAATNTVGTALGTFHVGGLTYLADGESGLQVYGLNDTGLPTYFGGYNSPGFARDVFVSGGRAYLADGTNGLQILSATNPANMTLLGTFDTSGELRHVKVYDTFAFLADDTNGLMVLNVASPASPVVLGTYPQVAPARDLEVVGNIALVAQGTNGLTVLDVSNPQAITVLGTASPPVANAVRIEGKFAYVAGGTNGIYIYELAGLEPDYPEITSYPADIIALPGESVALLATASGTPPLTYQWFKDGESIRDGPFASGVSSGTLSLSNLQYTNSGTYTLEVRNGWNLADYAVAEVKVVPVGTPVLTSGYFDQNDALNLHVVGQTAHVASRLAGLQIIDWSDPLNPVLVGAHPTLSLAQDVRVKGRFAYVASWDAGLEIFDLYDPTKLSRVGNCDTAGLARQVRLNGDFAFVADHEGGVAVIDVRNPHAPQLVGRANTLGFAEGIATGGRHAYVAAAQAGLQIFDTANPLALMAVSQLDSPGHAEGVTLHDNQIYLADYNRGLRIISVADPANPVLLGSHQTVGDTFQVQIDGSRVYLAEGIKAVSVLEVTNTATPAYITESLAGESVHGLAVQGNYALYADRLNGLLIANLLGFPPVPPTVQAIEPDGANLRGSELVLSAVSEGTPPLTFQWYRNGSPLTTTANISGIDKSRLRIGFLDGTNVGNYYAVVANAQGSATSSVFALSVQIPGAISLQGNFDTPGLAAAAISSGHVAYVADGPNALHLVDLTNPQQPVGLGTYTPTGSIQGLCIQSNLLFLALGVNGVSILDISTPEAPRFVGAFDSPGTAQRIFVTNGVAYVADGVAGLRLYNVSNPGNAVALGFVDTAGFASDVCVAGNYAYVADGPSGVKIINISNPAAPAQIGSYASSGSANAVRIRGNTLYLASGSGGLVVLNVTTPNQPQPLGAYVTPNARDLELAGDFVVLLDASQGCLVLNASNPQSITLVTSLPQVDATDLSIVDNLLLLAAGTNGLQVATVLGVSPTLPRFLLQPVSQTVSYGGTAQFRAWPEGGTPPQTFRWYHDGFPLFDDARISGASLSTLTISNVSFADSGLYSLRVYGPAGVTNSAAAALTFIGPLQTQINQSPTGAVIHLMPGVHLENLVIDRDLTLTGNWWDKPTLSGGRIGRALRISPGAKVALRGVALRSGYSPEDGGAIRNEGWLSLEHCLIADSSAANGGGVANFGTLTLWQSVVSNNYVSGSGGGILNAWGANTFLTNSQVVENQADSGGGIANLGTNRIVRSLIAANAASGLGGDGGGVRTTSGLLQIMNATVSGNSAASISGLLGTGTGGGLQAGGGRVELAFATVAQNNALVAGGGISTTANAEVHLRNSILADNFASLGPDADGILHSDGYNLIEDGLGFLLLGDPTGNQIGVNAKLGPLADNGGPTWTHAPADDSPAIDAAAPPGPATDARGIPRPFDLPWRDELASYFDLGALEYVNQTPYLRVSNRFSAGFTLLWATNSILQRATTPAGGWVDQTNPSPFFVATTALNQGYFRLRRPLVAPVLTCSTITSAGFELSWPNFGVLERAPSPDGPWEAITGQSPYHVDLVVGQNEFFRVRVLDY